MRAEHLAIDGSIVSVEADADLSGPVTASGWAIVPAIMRPHPFTVYPAGHSERVRKIVQKLGEDVQILSTESYKLHDRELTVYEAEVATAAGGRRQLTVGAWEGKRGCLATSVTGKSRAMLTGMFETLQFSESDRGLAIDAPVTTDMRPPQLLGSAPELGVILIRPAVGPVLASVPRSRGARVAHGELFRFQENRDGLLYVGATCTVSVRPRDEASLERMLPVVESMRVEWTPRSARN